MNEKRVFLTKHSPEYWRVTLNHPPVNIFGPKTIPQLNEVITAIETDKELKVVVFDSAIDGFFMSNPVPLRGNSPSGAVRAFTCRPFPLRTLMVCFTIWLIATQAMVFDQVKFDERAQLLEQTTRSLGAPRVVNPSERPSNSSSGAELQRL